MLLDEYLKNPCKNPEILYRKCGFVGNDLWLIMEKKDVQ